MAALQLQICGNIIAPQISKYQLFSSMAQRASYGLLVLEAAKHYKKGHDFQVSDCIITIQTFV